MLDKVLVNAYLPPAFDKKEILRYAKCQEGDEGVERLLHECLQECENAFSYRVCYRIFQTETFLEKFGGNSKSLQKNLDGCTYAVAFAATVGISIDRLITKYANISTVKSLLFQAIGAERIESLCDVFCEDIKKKGVEKGYESRPRFSPGYGDFSLQEQGAFLQVLNAFKMLGLSLTDSLLMTPTKSVTAVVGLRKK